MNSLIYKTSRYSQCICFVKVIHSLNCDYRRLYKDLVKIELLYAELIPLDKQLNNTLNGHLDFNRTELIL